HRGSHHWRKSRHQSIQLYRKVRRKLDAGCATYSHRLMHKPEEERAHVLVIADDPEGLARACGDAGRAREDHKLLPDFGKHVIAHRYVDSGSLHLLHVTGEHGIGMPIGTAAVDFGHCAGVADHAGPRDVRDDIGRPRNRGLISKDRGESLGAVNAVLKRDHTGIGADERARLLTRRLGIPELYGEQHHIDWSDLLRIVGDVGVLQLKVAGGTLYLGAVAANGSARRAAAHERTIMPGRGHPPAEITSHGTRCHDRDPHLAPPRPG